MRVPAVCDICGAIFPSGIEAVDSRNITISGSSGPCPRCGGMSHIPDGVYNFIGNTIELLSGPSRTIAELTRFAEILEKAREERSTVQELEEKIDSEVPALASLKDILPRSRAELYSFIVIIIAIISLLINEIRRDSLPRIQTNQVINYIYEQNYNIVTPSLSHENQGKINTQFQRNKDKKVGRNAPCPCGSGKKYKKCCFLKNN